MNHFRRPLRYTANIKIEPKKASRKLAKIITFKERRKKSEVAELERRVQRTLKNFSVENMLRDFESFKMRLARIEDRLDFLLYVNDMDVNQLRDAPNAALEKAYDLLVSVVEADIQNIPAREFRRWSQLILNISEVEYDRMADILNVSAPWMPMYAATYKMLMEVADRIKIHKADELQMTYRLIEKARKHVVNSATVFIKTRELEGLEMKFGSTEADKFFSDSWNRYILDDIKNNKQDIINISKRKL